VRDMQVLFGAQSSKAKGDEEKCGRQFSGVAHRISTRSSHEYHFEQDCSPSIVSHEMKATCIPYPLRGACVVQIHQIQLFSSRNPIRLLYRELTVKVALLMKLPFSDFW